MLNFRQIRPMMGAPPQMQMPQPQQMQFPNLPPPPQVQQQQQQNPMAGAMAMMKFAGGDKQMDLGLRNLFTGWQMPGSPDTIQDDPLGLAFSMGADQYL